MKRNKNRGYQQLRVWHDALGYYKQTWEVFRKLSFELRRVASQQIASSDSVHRNIAERKAVPLMPSNKPIPQHSITPTLHYSVTSLLHYSFFHITFWRLL
jgi:hypothetical protein